MSLHKQMKHLFITVLIFSLLVLHVSLHHATAQSAFDQVVVVQTVGEYDEQAVSEMRARLAKIHPAFMNVLAQRGIELKLINFPLTDLPEYAYLQGIVPRGWEHTGHTWDQVPGAGGDPSVARIGFSDPDPAHFHDTNNLELHEIAHAIDQFVFYDISYDEAFLTIHAAERKHYLPDPYFDYPEEYFAEAFAAYYLSDAAQAELREKAPRTYTFIKELPANIPGAVPPELHLHGEASVKLHVGDVYEEMGASAVDSIYGDLTDAIEVSGAVDTSAHGTYEVTYNVENEAGLASTVTRTVTVVRGKLADFSEYRKASVNYLGETVGEMVWEK